MKKITILLFALAAALVMMPGRAGAQLCGPSLITEYIPSPPQAFNSFSIVTQVTFCSSGCERLNVTLQEGLDFIEIHSYYCIGMLTALCDATDTTVVAGVPAGDFEIRHFIYESSDCITYTPVDTVLDTVTVQEGTSRPAPRGLIQLGLQPNPSSGDFFVSTSEALNEPGILQCHDAQGRLVYQQNLYAGESEWSLSPNASPGIYFVELRSGGMRGTVTLILHQ